MKVQIKPHEKGRMMDGRSLFKSGFSSIGFTTRKELVEYLIDKGWQPADPLSSLMEVFNKPAQGGKVTKTAVIYTFMRHSNHACRSVIYYYRTFIKRG